MREKKIDILGTPYQLIVCSKEEDSKLHDADGYTDHTTKKCFVEDMKPDNQSLGDLKEYQNIVIRHELTHAFLFESGMAAYSYDEKLVDWIAFQFKKLQKAFEEAGAL